MNRPINVLLDRSVEDRFRLSEGLTVKQVINWGGIDHEVMIPAVRLRRDIARSPWISSQAKFLPTLSRLAVQGAINFYSYPELHHESLMSSAQLYLVTRGDLRKFKLQHLDAPIDRSFFQMMELSAFLDPRALKNFYRFLRDLDVDQLRQRSPDFFERLPATTKLGLSQHHRFCELYDAAREKHARDAFHLWAAEIGSLDYFLTMDKKFINQMTKTARVDIRVNPLLPEHLVAALGITELDEMPVKPGVVYTVNGTFDETTVVACD